MTSPVEVVVRGPVFDGRATAAGRELCDAIEWSVATQAYAEARQIMDASFKHPTPYYEVQVTVQRHPAETVVHDRGIVYGPWLVGVTQRNRTTGFKGYDMYRRAVQAVLPKISMLVQHVLPPFLRRMNG